MPWSTRYVVKHRHASGIAWRRRSLTWLDDIWESYRWRLSRQCIMPFRSRIQALKLNDYPDTDWLDIELSDRPGADNREIPDEVVLDCDATDKLVGIDIHNAGNIVELKKLILSKLPGRVETAAA